MNKNINIAIVGLGQIGIYLYNELRLKKKDIEKKTGKKINLEKYFFQRDINYVKTLSLEIIQNYYSKNFIPPKKLVKINFFPLKSEILVWKNSFKHARIKQIVSIPYFYIKRVILINKFFVKNDVFPRAIGAKS